MLISHEHDQGTNLETTTPEERLSMMWHLSLDVPLVLNEDLLLAFTGRELFQDGLHGNLGAGHDRLCPSSLTGPR